MSVPRPTLKQARALIAELEAELDELRILVSRLNSVKELQHIMKINNDLMAERGGLRAAVLAEREACAAIADNNRHPRWQSTYEEGFNDAAADLAAAIRARPAP